MLKIYSQATLETCYFEGNEAADSGGAIFVKIVSFIKLTDSTFRLNTARKSGGSIRVQHSMAIIESCSFSNESVVYGLGGAIIAENFANVTIQASLFYNCIVLFAGLISVAVKSVLNIGKSNFTESLAREGGTFHIFQNSFVTGHDITVADGKSNLGAGFHVQDSSRLNLKLFNMMRNAVSDYGGAVYCKQSQVIFENGILLDNYAKLDGGSVFGKTCKATFDYCKFVNNNALGNGGGIYFTASSVEIHNSEGGNNIAGNGSFGFITMKSKFQSNNLQLPNAERNCIWIYNDSVAEMKHTNLSNLNGYCPIVARKNCQILVDYYLTNDTRRRLLDSNNTESVLCTDDTSSENGTFGGNYIPFPEIDL